MRKPRQPRQRAIPQVRCPYCNQPARLCTSAEVYNGRQYGGWFWKCDPCGAWVGCHGTTKNPLGTLAKQPLRALRKQLHGAFDPLWKDRSPLRMERAQAYAWLASSMNIPVAKCHIAQFNEEQCRQALTLVSEFRGTKPPIFQDEPPFIPGYLRDLLDL